ncbi:MAG: hypothetical protein MI784_13320 [Cytophagales bacterium]|nr:hypothetical protein [Cytophagales bacterium]
MNNPTPNTVAAADSIEELKKLPKYAIRNVNWPDRYPLCPEVRFQLGWSETGLMVRFQVKEEQMRRICLNDNEEVYEDSCVEFFFRPEGETTYFNLEFNSRGTLLLGHGEPRNRRRLPPEQTELVTRNAFLLSSEKNGKTQFEWELRATIPLELIRQEYPDFILSPNCILEINAYKCGDKLPEPHFVSLFPIFTEKPNFHCPQFFQPVRLKEMK